MQRRKPRLSNGIGRDAQFVNALARGLAVLECFKGGDPPLSNQEMARRTELARPTVSRLTHTLSELGYLNYDARSGCYELGGSALALGQVATENLSIDRVARPLLQEFADLGPLTVGLGARERDQMVYLQICIGSAPLALRLEVGARVPIASTGMGRAWLSMLDEAERERVLDVLARREPESWPAMRKAIDRSLAEIARRGYCTVIGEWQQHVNGVAAPLRLPHLAGRYALNCGGPAYMLPADELVTKYAPALLRTANRIAEMLGSRGGRRGTTKVRRR
jgi:DNA-binding IclR family transcriptional regulator